MNESQESFEKDLEQLIKIFRKIRAKTHDQKFEHLDPMFLQNLDFIINNYEMMKNNIPVEMLKQMGIPFQTMLHDFIGQLKAEFGEDFEEEEKIVEHKTTPSDIDQIDILLKKPGLSEEEIDRLLDRRSRLVKERENNKLPENF